MNDKTFQQLRRLDARVRELENLNNEMSNFISEIEQDFTQRHDLLVDQVNTFMHEYMSKIENLEQSRLERLHNEKKD